MAALDIRAILLGTVAVGIVLILPLAIVLLLRVLGLNELAFGSALAWEFLVFPHHRIVATAQGPLLFPGLLAPCITTLQWLIVGVCAGVLTRKRNVVPRLLLAAALVGVVGSGVLLAVHVSGYQLAFP